MANTPQQSDPKRKRKLIVLGAITAALVLAIVALFIWGGPLIELFQDPERARELITQAGPWGPLVFILMQLVQVLIAPIPGQVTGFLSGFLFGTFWGTTYTMVGTAIGFTLIFVLARKLGRPFVEYFVDKKLLDKFDYLAGTNGVFVLFLIFLLPAFPDDVICYIAGLTKIRISTLIIISLIGRFPGLLVLNLAGAGVAESNVQLTVILVTVTCVLLGLAVWQRKRLERFVKRFAKREET